MRIGLILGSGLGGLADSVRTDRIIEYSEIDSGLKSTVDGHAGKMLLGKLAGHDVAVMQGRIHYYEGRSMQQINKSIDYMADELGVDTLIITNAAGAVNENYCPGDLVLINDHISSFVPSPLIGIDLTERTGARFHDMSEIYTPELRGIIHREAEGLGIDIKEGIYLQTTGPNYETPAEIRMFRTLGADVVGMSTANEAMYAHALGIKVAAISCVSNMAAGIGDEKLSHEDVKQVADLAGKKLQSLIENVLQRI